MISTLKSPAPAKCDSTPYVLRGLDSQKPLNEPIRGVVGVHALRLSVDVKWMDDITRFVNHFFGSNADAQPWGRWRYTRSWAWPVGVMLLFHDDPLRLARLHNNRICLDVSGSALDRLKPLDLEFFIGGLAAFEPSCSRIDLYFDDYSRAVTPYEVFQEAERGNYALFRSHKPLFERKRNGQLTNDGVAFGARGNEGGGLYFRIYDKELESNGENTAVRFELECADQKADSVFRGLSGCQGDLEAFTTAVAAPIGGCIDFLDRSGDDPNLSRCERLKWWASIREFLGYVRIRPEHEEGKILQRAEKFLRKQAGPSLALMREAHNRAFGGSESFLEWLTEVCDVGRNHFTAKHMNALNNLAQENEVDSNPFTDGIDS